MPIDPSIALSYRPGEPVNPLAIAMQVQQMRAMQENARGLAEQRQAIAEQRRAQTDTLERTQREEQTLRTLFSGQQPPTNAQIYSVVGPQRGAEIVKGLQALRTQEVKDYGELQQVVGASIGAIKALPANMQKEAYDLAVQTHAAKGWIDPQQIQPFSPEAIAYYQRWAMTPEKQWEIDNPKPVEVSPGASLVNPQTGAVAYTAPKAEQKPASALEYEYAVKQGFKGSYEDYQNKDANRKATRINMPAQPSFSRAEVTDAEGNTVLANYDARSGKYFDVNTGKALAGISGAPTAEMKNKAAAKDLVSNAIGALKTYSDGILTKVGPRQRADAIKRGAQAVFGNDPEFRTYQDARVALAGNLAVAQQGARPSDADILKVWLPLVPDPYSDTSESARMKWELIKTMSLPKHKGQQAKPDAGSKTTIGRFQVEIR